MASVHVFVLPALILVCGCMGLSSANLNTGQTCYSRYDYDEKLLLKLLKIEQEIAKFEQIVGKLKLRENDVLARQNRENKEVHVAMKRLEATYRVMEINFNNSIAQMMGGVEKLKTEIKGPYMNYTEVFTVKEPKAGPNASTIGFKQSVLIEGTGFNINSGQFTCNVPGIYFFSVYMVKVRSTSRVDVVTCTICKNGAHVVNAYIDPDDTADIGSYGVSNAAYMKLVKGDVVGLCECSGVDTMDPQSSFSGRLVM